MLHVRLICPADCTDRVRDILRDGVGVTNLVVLPGAGHDPEGDVLLADVAREAASEVFEALREVGLEERGSIAVESVDLSLSSVAERAERLAPGLASDAIVWEELEARTREESSVSGAFLVLFACATTLAGIAVLLDSAILVIGAMIVGPEFGALARVCAGTVLGRWAVVRRGLIALAVGFPAGIVAAVVATWLLAALGLIESAALFEPRPQTEFIYLPDTLSFVVAFLAGIAGMQALTSAKSGAVLGVLVSVTTIPAAGNLAVALAYGLTPNPAQERGRLLDQALTSGEQLVLNLLGIVVAGTLTLAFQQALRRRVGRGGHRTRADLGEPVGSTARLR